MAETPLLNRALQTTPSLFSAAQTGSVTLEAMLTSLPDSLQNLSRTVTLEGTLMGMLSTDATTLRTAAGEITISLSQVQQNLIDTLNNALGNSKTPVTLSIEAGNPPQKATLLLQHAPAASNTAKNAPEMLLSPQASSLAKPPIPTATTPQLTTGSTTQISLIQSGKQAAMPVATGTTPQQIAQPVQTATNLVAIKALGHLIEQIQSQSATPTNAAPPVNNAPAAPLALPPSGEITIRQIFLPDQSVPETLPQGQSLATLVGKTPSGHGVFQSEQAIFYTHDTTDLPLGAKIAVTMQTYRDAPLPTLPRADARDFAELKELVATLQQIDPQLAQQFIADKIPSPQQHFAGTMLFFLSALQSGKLEEWLGAPVLQALARNNKMEVKETLTENLRHATRQEASDPKVGDWLSYALPVHTGGGFEKIQLYVHQDASQKDEAQDAAASQKKKTRFVVNVSMSRLGEIQMDGLCQPKQLDLILRSEHELPAALTTSIRETALASLETIGLTGTILFQTGRKHWVTIENKVGASSVYL